MERPLVGRPPKECSIGPAPLTVAAQHAGAGAVQDESLRATSLLSFDGRAHASAASPSAAGRSIEASPLPEVIAAPPDTHESDLSAMVKGEQIANARAAAQRSRRQPRPSGRRPRDCWTAVVRVRVAPSLRSTGGSPRTTARAGAAPTTASMSRTPSAPPIVSAMDGVVIDSGPASGFGAAARPTHSTGRVSTASHSTAVVEIRPLREVLDGYAPRARQRWTIWTAHYWWMDVFLGHIRIAARARMPLSERTGGRQPRRPPRPSS